MRPALGMLSLLFKDMEEISPECQLHSSKIPRRLSRRIREQYSPSPSHFPAHKQCCMWDHPARDFVRCGIRFFALKGLKGSFIARSSHRTRSAGATPQDMPTSTVTSGRPMVTSTSGSDQQHPSPMPTYNTQLPSSISPTAQPSPVTSSVTPYSKASAPFS
jgi:hypothetical protein